jgi:hypothetical protein
MRGLTLRVTNNTSAPLTVTDVTGLATFAVGETRDILYSDDVQASLEYGRLNALIIAGSVSVLFVSGTNLNQAPIGRTFTGATPVVAGDRGLVPTATVAQRGSFLRGDALWISITPAYIGAIPATLLTTQGDLIVRGATTAEKLPLGSLGYVLRSGPITTQWVGMAASGLLAARPSATAFYAGSYYWATDTSTLYACYYDGAWVWGAVNVMGGGTPSPLEEPPLSL